MERMVSEPITYCAGWTLLRIDECDSTNDFARDMELWSAVSANRQRKGRGRYNRLWLSDEGGAWFSAVVPAPITDPMSRLTPLMAGLAVANTLIAYGLDGVRFRWPNDVMVHEKKCAGILVDRFVNDRCVIGIGINVWNDPAQSAPELAGMVTSMHDWLPKVPEPYEVTVRVLVALRTIVLGVKKNGGSYLIEQLTPYWNVGRKVEIERNGRRDIFVFGGVDNKGQVIVSNKENGPIPLAPEDITLFREL